MAAPVWSVGQVLAASDVNNWFVPQVAYRTSNSSQVKSTTLTNDPVLFIPVAANAAYEFRMYLYAASASTSSGMKIAFTGPAGSSGAFSGAKDNAGGGAFINPTSLGVAVSGVVGGTANANYSSRYYGLFQTAGTAGNFQFQYAEDATDAVNGCYVFLQSVLILDRSG